MKPYTVAFNGQQFGPHSQQEVAQMLASGQIDSSAMVWQEGWANWQPVTSIAAAAPQQQAYAPQQQAYGQTPQGQYPQQQFYQQPSVEDNSGKATASLVLGIISIPAAACACAGFILAIIGLVLGNSARTSSKPGVATAGIILSAIGLVLSIISAIIGAMVQLNHGRF